MLEDDRLGALSYATAGLAGMAGWTINEWLVLGTFVLAAATFGVNWWYKRKLFKNSTRMTEKKIEHIDTLLEKEKKNDGSE